MLEFKDFNELYNFVKLCLGPSSWTVSSWSDSNILGFTDFPKMDRISGCELEDLLYVLTKEPFKYEGFIYKAAVIHGKYHRQQLILEIV
jgi:hypothetical protein